MCETFGRVGRSLGMSVSGLRFRNKIYSSVPNVTKNGVFIFGGNPADYHEWEFRTELRIVAFEQQEKRRKKKNKKDKGDSSFESSTGPEQSRAERSPQAGAEARAGEGDGGAAGPDQGPTRPRAVALESPAASEVAPVSSSDDDGAVEAVLKVMEGLRGDAFQKAKDLGIVALSGPDGLRTLIKEIKAMVFPLGTLEAQALFRSGQAIRGPLSRQDGESVVSYIGRRRRWWTLMTQMDSRISLSDSLRAELLLELSGLSRDQQLMIKACAGGVHEFDKYAQIMTEHHGLIHLRGNKLLDSAPLRAPGSDRNTSRWTPQGIR